MSFDTHLTRARVDVDYDARATVSADSFAHTIDRYHRLSELALPLMEHAARRYDTASDEVLDVLGAGGMHRPAVIFIHGGYWRALSRGHSRFMAPMLARHGIATVVPDYTLAPAATLTEITRQMRAALAHVWTHADDLGIDRRRIFAVGSSAGGHLAACLACAGWQDGFGVPKDVLAGAMPVSGLFDLAPIARGHPQEWLHLTGDEVQALNPLRHIPTAPCPMTVALASHEAAGFARQSRAMAEAWPGAQHLEISGRDHFDVILDLTDEDSTLSEALLRMIHS